MASSKALIMFMFMAYLSSVLAQAGSGTTLPVSAVENGSKKIVLRSSDGEVFEVEEVVAVESQTIKHMIEDDNVVIPLPNVTGKILSKVIEYCKRHKLASSTDVDLKAFDADFVKVDHATLFDLILAANYLNIKTLLDLTCQTVADMIKGKTPEEIRKMFNIKNDLIYSSGGPQREAFE